MSTIYKISGPMVTQADTASHLKGDAQTNRISSDGAANVNFTNPISFINVNSPQLVGTASQALNLPKLPGVAAYNFTSSWANNTLNARNSLTSSYLNYVGGNTGTASYSMVTKQAVSSSYALTSSYSNNSTTASYALTTPNSVTSNYVLAYATVTATTLDKNTWFTTPITINKGYNIASITGISGGIDPSTGAVAGTHPTYAFTVTFTNQLPSLNYIVVGTGWEYDGNYSSRTGCVFITRDGDHRTLTSCDIVLLGNFAQKVLPWGMSFQVLGY